MAKQNILKEAKDIIKTVQDKKAAEYEQIQKNIETAESKKHKAEEAIKSATELMDIEAYEAATEDRKKAQITIEMYNNHLEQLKRQEYISEKESDDYLKGLESYEKEIDEEFKEKLLSGIKPLAKMLEEYNEKIEEVEETIKTWESSVHANYRSNITTFSDGTNRSSTPIPLHTTPYKGNKEAIQFGAYLNKLDIV